MSGIVGVVHFDGCDVNHGLVHGMTRFMRYRGPDALRTKVDGPVGFGYALLATTPGSRCTSQPFALGDTCIVADARIDGRDDLIHSLRSSGRLISATAGDAELILQAYHLWGERCVERLLGDFAFAIWDSHGRKLLLARDQLGVRPLYYSCIPGGIVFSNTLDVVRLHPSVSGAVNELSIADFLLFGHNLDTSTTSFRDISCLKPGHLAVTSAEGMRSRGYWELPIPSQLRYRREEEYLDHFRMLLDKAVADRLCTKQVGVFMSGGLDSTSLAAIAHRTLSEGGNDFDLRAYSVVYRSLIPDDDEQFSRLVAEYLGIPIRHVPLDGYPLFARFGDLELDQPEPYLHPHLAATLDVMRECAVHSRVALNGEDVDTLLHPVTVREMMRGMPWWHVANDVVRYWIRHRRPVFDFGILRRLYRRPSRRSWRPHYPEWLDEVLEERLALKKRWEAELTGVANTVRHPRSAVYDYLSHPRWQQFLRSQDPGVTGVPLEIRFPYLDLRVVEFCLALPPLPWCMGKYLLRAAMRGRLPEVVRSRPKAILQGHPYHLKLGLAESGWIDQWNGSSEISNFVCRGKIPVLCRPSHGDGGGIHPAVSWVHLRPLVLQRWLSQRGPTLLHPPRGIAEEAA